ncbi:MAG: AAA family ATPase [Candidatus Poribacteria bacterium]|nr:AAA family ATPase [Candidatus Poribacteria bacterium]
MHTAETETRISIEQIDLRDFRCFRGEHSARLAPLTLVVGENSTGKTSFLALVRALWQVAHNNEVPDFKEEPYDLGSFSEIVHRRGGSAPKLEQFEADLRIRDADSASTSFGVTFERKGTAPFPTVRKISNRKGTVSAKQANGNIQIRAETKKGSTWNTEVQVRFPQSEVTQLVPLHFLWVVARDSRNESTQPPKDIEELLFKLQRFGHEIESRPFASAPVRSKPHRTYDPSRPARDPEGDYVPMYLAYLARQHPKEWSALKKKLMDFGAAAGLFDEIEIKSLGKHEGRPFQIEVRKRGEKLSGPWRNLVDVGYGVSQVLPLVTELMRPDAPSLVLLQQPEVHLHPSAQAALGGLFCHLATDRQIIAETHSNFLLDRIRMDIRDERTPLSPDDISILYFERKEIDVHIHSIRIDEDGNVIGAPPSYGNFFMEEAARSGQY